MIPMENLPQDLDELRERKSLKQGLSDPGILTQVEKIVDAVCREGDKALVRFSSQFDGTELEPASLRVGKEEIEEAYKNIDDQFLEAIRTAKDRIDSYHVNQKENSWFVTEEDGVILGQMVRPMERVGIYVPGGLASYPSSVLMNAVPAKVAGVGQIAMCTPPSPTGKVNPHTLVAAKEVGVDEIYKVGGAQAVAALAFGTETIKKVYKIAGPGNIYVTIAKKLVVGEVDIDMLAGPSEIVIVADDSADPDFIAADMLGQAEHAPDASAILITTSSSLARQVSESIVTKLDRLSRKDIAAESIENRSKIFVAASRKQAVAAANSLAPEHLELMLDEPFSYLSQIENAGAVFVGSYTPEAVGDYIAGPNHVLPTGGTARFYSCLGVYDFVKRISVLSYSRKSLDKVGGTVEVIAQAEGLDAHARSVRERLESEN